MLITIYDKTGNSKVELSPNDSSTQVKEIQGDSVLTLSFTHYEHIDLDVDDYADFEGERFWLTEKYRPKQKSAMEWSYDIKLYGIESMIKRFLVIKTVDNEDEPVFTLTASPREHVAMIVKCMNDGMGNISDWKVGQVDGTENIVIDYFGKYCDEALREIAGKVGAECWVEGQTVNISKCEHGEPVRLGYNMGLLSIDPGTADNVKFYTRLYPVGSSRNIDREKYGFTRLQLPGGQKYVEINADKYGRVDHSEADAFSDIYPRRIGTVSNVRSEVKTGEDGNPFTIYYFTDESLPFDPNSYKIGGLVIRVSFQEGSELAGLGEEEDGTYYFEVNFDSTTREFEIITIWPYDNDVQLPGGKLVPKAGDKYILWNLRMPDEYYGLAEQEFLAAVNKYNEEHSLDISVYKAPTDHVWIENNNVELTIGRRVRLESEKYFPGVGYRDSRITKITRKVNLPSSMDIEIGDALSRTSQEKMADSIADVRSYARSMGASMSLPDIIRTGDSTKPTDNNLLSAKRSVYDFFSRKLPDTAAGLKKFLDGLETGSYSQGISGARISPDGNAEFGEVVARERLEVGDYVGGSSGGAFWVDANGEAHIETSTITVNKKLTVKEVEIQQQSWVGGSQISSPAAMLCDRVEPVYNAGGTLTQWRCYFLANDAQGRSIRNEFKVGDLVRCETFNLVRDAHGNLTNRYYWRRVTATDAVALEGSAYNWIVLSNKEGSFDPASTCAPAPGDRMITVGNDTDESRQNVIITSSYGTGAPYIYQYAGINSFSMAGKLKTRISPSGNRFTGEFRLEVDGVEKGDVGDLISANAGKIASLEIAADGIIGKVGKICRNIIPLKKGIWSDDRNIYVLVEKPENGALYAEQLEPWYTDANTSAFRCRLDASLFAPGTDYTLTFYATWWNPTDEGAPMPASMKVCASLINATTGVSQTEIAEAQSKPYMWSTQLRQTIHLRTISAAQWNPGDLVLTISFFTGSGAPDWPADALRFDMEQVKLERGTVATPFVAAGEDLESIIAQQAGQIAAAVKVDGVERAGLTLDAEEGITLQADKVKILNGETIAALFAGGAINADLLNVGKLTTLVDGTRCITISEFDDGFIRFYQSDGIKLACKIGLEKVALESSSTITPEFGTSSQSDVASLAESTETPVSPTFNGGKLAIIQVYNEEGELKWVLFLDGPQTPGTQTYRWVSLSLTPPGKATDAEINSTKTLKATEHFQFKVADGKGSEPYKSQHNHIFRSRISDTWFSSAANYYAPNGTYYAPTAQVKKSTVGTTNVEWQRKYFVISSGLITSEGYINIS